VKSERITDPREVKSIPNFIFRSGEETRVSRLVSVYMFRRRISLY
jgi:hypothetical protein